MLNLKSVVLIVFTSQLLFSCTNGVQESESVIESFAKLAKDTINRSKVTTIYPHYDLLAPYVTVGDLSINECKENNNGTYTVTGTNGYYDKNGKFIQNDVSFIVGTDKTNYVIKQSIGLFQLSKEMHHFGQLVGAIKTGDTDLDICKKYDKLYTLFLQTYAKSQVQLNNGIKINYWEWEADFGIPSGKATVTNKLPFDVYNVKYKIVFSQGSTKVGEDEGLAFSKLKSGEKKTFTFYSSGISGNAENASLSFELPEELAIEWMLNDSYTGKEFNNYTKGANKHSNI